MFPTISPGDLCLCKMKDNYISADLKKQMIVLFKHEDYNFILTKRIIATVGELVTLKNDTTYINGIPLAESYAFFSEKENSDKNLNSSVSIRVDKGKVFVMGDNRNNSLDSRDRDFGLVNITEIVGRPIIVLWSKDKSKICTTF
jgi:signal peptidase I